MSNHINIQGYLNTINEKWGKLFYKMVCHNVLEYMEEDEREALFQAFQRLLKPEGYLYCMRGTAVSANFGNINEYDDCELEKLAQGAFRVEKVYGVQTFFCLQRNEWKTEADWISKMYELECEMEEHPVFREAAFSII